MYKTVLLLLLLIQFQLSCFPVKNEDGFILITSLYNEIIHERALEYLACLQHNTDHPLIKKIHILYDTSKDPQNSDSAFLKKLYTFPVIITKLPTRPDFAYCFNLVNNLYDSEKNIIICNADIFFNETLYLLIDYDLRNKFLVLSRWDITKTGALCHYNNKESQDAWIFQTPVKKFNKASFCIGTKGCDNFIALQAQNAGYTVINPSLTIQACHVHLTEVRHYITGGKITKDILAVKSCHLRT
jgi:hypothetical protein